MTALVKVSHMSINLQIPKSHFPLLIFYTTTRTLPTGTSLTCEKLQPRYLNNLTDMKRLTETKYSPIIVSTDQVQMFETLTTKKEKFSIVIV